MIVNVLFTSPKKNPATSTEEIGKAEEGIGSNSFAPVAPQLLDPF